jgi:hypothetical protein
MRYLVTLFGDESQSPQPGTPEFDTEMAEYMAFGERAGSAIVAGEALQPGATAATIRPGVGDPLVTAGPFTETTEVIGGFYVLETGTLDDAIELARHIPAARRGWVEVRPLVQWSDRGREPGAEGGVPEGRDRYMALIYGKETAADVPDTPEWEEGAAAHGRFVEWAGDDVQAGGALRPASTTTTLRVRDGDVLVTDGPFSEAAEVVGGLYVFGPVTRDRAVELAARIPVNPSGAIHLHPIWEIA